MHTQHTDSQNGKGRASDDDDDGYGSVSVCSLFIGGSYGNDNKLI